MALPPQWRHQKILSTIGFKAATHRCSTFLSASAAKEVSMHAVAVTWQLAMLIIVKKARVRRLQTVKKVEEKDDAGRVTRRYLCMGMQKPVQVPEGTLKKMLLIVQAHDVKTCQQKLIAQGIITPESQFKLGEYRKLFEKFCLLLHLPQKAGGCFARAHFSNGRATVATCTRPARSWAAKSTACCLCREPQRSARSRKRIPWNLRRSPRDVGSAPLGSVPAFCQHAG